MVEPPVQGITHLSLMRLYAGVDLGDKRSFSLIFGDLNADFLVFGAILIAQLF
jgi:hypothetical protein